MENVALTIEVVDDVYLAALSNGSRRYVPTMDAALRFWQEAGAEEECLNDRIRSQPNLIEAIRLVRKEKGFGLKEAKEFAENAWYRLHVPMCTFRVELGKARDYAEAVEVVRRCTGLQGAKISATIRHFTGFYPND